MDILLEKRLWKALDFDCSSENLKDIVLSLKTEGFSQREVYNIFNEFLKQVMERGTEIQDDHVRDIMDLIVGWGSPNNGFWETYLKK